MPRTAPIPNMAVIPGMCPGMIIAAGGGGGGGSGAGSGKGKGGKKGAGTGDGEEGAEGGKKNASSCGGGAATGEDGAACPGNHSSASKAGGGAVGEPVDVVTGRVFTVPKIDLELGGSFPFVFHRAYSSFAKAVDFGMGRGWGHSFAWGIREGRRNSVLWTNGAADHGFDSLAPGEAAQFAHGWILVRREDGSYVLDTGNGIWRRFEHREGTPVLTAPTLRLRRIWRAGVDWGGRFRGHDADASFSRRKTPPLRKRSDYVRLAPRVEHRERYRRIDPCAARRATAPRHSGALATAAGGKDLVVSLGHAPCVADGIGARR